MMNARQLHRQRTKTRPQYRVSDAARAGAIVLVARTKLKEFADAELPDGKWLGLNMNPTNPFTRIYMRLGFVDGVGLLLKLADFQTNADGSLAPEDLKRFHSEGAEFIEVLQGSALNNTVLNSLMLTILVALMVLHTGDHAYVMEGAPPRFGGVTPRLDGGAWGDFASFASPEDAATQQAIRRTLYVLECALVAISTQFASVGLWQAMGLYLGLSSGLPSVTAKMDYLKDKTVALGLPGFGGFGMSLLVLVWALPMIAARASAIAFFCALFVCARWQYHDVWDFAHGPFMAGIIRAQHAEAQLVFAPRDEDVPRDVREAVATPVEAFGRTFET